MTVRRAVLAAGALVATLVLASCGGDDESLFRDEVDAIEEAVGSGDREAALEAFEALRADVGRARQAGEVDDARFTELSVLVEESRVLLDTVLPAPTTAPPPSEPVDPPDHDDEDHGDEDDKNDKVDKNDKDDKDERDERDEDDGEGAARGERGRGR